MNDGIAPPIVTTVATVVKTGMSDERWKAWISFVQFLLGTFMVGIFGTIINNRIQTREVEIKEQELIFKNLPTVVSTNPADRRLMAQFYATVTRSPDIRDRWAAYRDELNKEIAQQEKLLAQATDEIGKSSDAKVIEQKQAVIQSIKAEITPSFRIAAQDSLPARVYFHIQNEGQRSKASSLAGALSQLPGLMVPGVELVAAAPSTTELRYFRYADAAEAQSIAQSLKTDGLETNAKYVGGYEASQKLRPRHFELWISSAWK